jgi:hypothetical protein
MTNPRPDTHFPTLSLHGDSLTLCAQRDSNPQPFDPKSSGLSGIAQASGSVREQSGADESHRHTLSHTVRHPSNSRPKALRLGGGNTGVTI